MGRVWLGGSSTLGRVQRGHLVILSEWMGCSGVQGSSAHMSGALVGVAGRLALLEPSRPGGLPGMAVSEWLGQLRTVRAHVPRENTEEGRLLRCSCGHPSMSLCRIPLAKPSPQGWPRFRRDVRLPLCGRSKDCVFNWLPPLLLGFLWWTVADLFSVAI